MTQLEINATIEPNTLSKNDYDVLLRYKTSLELEQVYDKDYFERLCSFIDTASNKMYHYCYNKGLIKYSLDDPEYNNNLAGLLLFSKKMLFEIKNSNFKIYDKYSNKYKLYTLEAFRIAEMNLARVGKDYGF